MHEHNIFDAGKQNPKLVNCTEMVDWWMWIVSTTVQVCVNFYTMPDVRLCSLVVPSRRMCEETILVLCDSDGTCY